MSETAVSRLKAPDPSGKQTLHWDQNLRGFGVLVSGVTNAKSYVVQQALKDGRTRRVTIGRTNVLSLDQATERAKEMLAVFYTGRDPKATRRGEATLRSALEEYLTARADLKPRSAANYRDVVRRYLAPWLDTPLRDITRQMVEERLREIGASAGNASANGTMRTLRVLYNFSADRAPSDNPMPPNPVRLKKVWLPVPVRTRSVRADEMPKFYSAVRALPNPVARDYILLLLFTGLRRREASELRWSEVDLEARVIRLPAARAKAVLGEVVNNFRVSPHHLEVGVAEGAHLPGVALDQELDHLVAPAVAPAVALLRDRLLLRVGLRPGPPLGLAALDALLAGRELRPAGGGRVSVERVQEFLAVHLVEVRLRVGHVSSPLGG